MGFKCGIVGLPNVGKSTLFNALTQAGIEAANYPFCTIEPNVGVVPMPDPRLDKVARIAASKQVIPTSMQFVDIAGLVAGAAQGEGLGNQFLSHIRETQAIAHVVRCFENEDVAHVAGQVDPLRDIEIIETELLLADMQTLEKVVMRVTKEARRGEKGADGLLAELQGLQKHLNEGKPARLYSGSEMLEEELNQLHLISCKPVLYIANVDETGLDNNPLVEQVRKYASDHDSEVVVVCAQIESELNELPLDERQDFLESLGLSEAGLNRVIRSGYQLLSLQTYFTAGPKEARAWTIPCGAYAAQAAGVIHTDFEKGFIRAEVIAYQDYIDCEGEQGAKEAGKWRLEGRDYKVKDGDVMLFRFNV